MAKVTGRAKVTVAGRFVDTFKGVSIEMGGTTRTTQSTDHDDHFSEARATSKLEIERAFTSGCSINDLDIAGEAVTVEFDTGQTYVSPSMWRTAPEVVTDDGKGKNTFEGKAFQEML